MSGEAIALRDLFRVHRTVEGDAAALQGLTLSVAAGERLVVLGPSGAGKSTLLRVLAGLEPPSAGAVRVLGADLGRLPARRRAAFRQAHVGLVDQHHDRSLPPSLRCRDAVALPLALRGAARRERARRAGELLERVGLADRADAHPHELSGGERQRVAVCAAVAHRPGLLLADEPGGELDAASAAAVYDLIAALARDEGTTVVVVSHDPAACARADRTVRLRDGRISGEAGALGEEAIVVGRGGWLRLPEELLHDAGLPARLVARARPGAIELRAADGAATPTPPPPPLSDRDRIASSSRQRMGAELRGVDKAYGARTVLRGLDAAFAPGRLTALSGRSGSGKSTVLRLLAGLERPDAGAVLLGDERIDDRDRSALAALRREHVAIVAQDVGLVGFLGAQENVELALAQRGVPERDARARAAVAELLAEAAARHGVTIVCATHDPLVVARADDRIAL